MVFREEELRKKLCDELFFPRVFDNIKQNRIKKYRIISIIGLSVAQYPKIVNLVLKVK